MEQSLFVTGGGGYLGQRVLALAGETGQARTICLSRSGRTPPGASAAVHGDILDGESYVRALEGCEAVLHMAAVTGKSPPAEYFRVNRDGTRALLAQCRKAGVKRILHVSTIAVQFPRIDHYPYAQSKLQAEVLVRESGMEYCIVRPTMIFGKGAPVLAGLSRLAAAPIIPLFDGGTAAVQPVFVDDLAKGLLAILNAGRINGETIGFGGPDVMTIKELLVEIRRSTNGRPARMVSIPAGPVSILLQVLEKVMRPLVPITAGQLMSFTSDGLAAPNESFDDGVTPVREILRMVTNR